MRVYFIESGLKGCYQVRCLLPLQANGWDGDQTSINSEYKTPENKALAAQASEIVVFHRPDDPKKLKLARLFKSVGKKIVFDNDDTFKDDGGFKLNDYMNEERMKRGMEKINDTIDTFIKEADLITCSTKFLKKEYEALNKNVVVLPNCVDPFYFDEPLKNYDGTIRIGIIGSLAITADVEIIKPIVEKYHNDKRVKIVVFSLPPKNQDKVTRELYADEYKFWESVNVEWQPFVDINKYYDTLNNLRLDLAIIPRADNYFNRCKSNLKFLECSMFEIPVLAQSFKDKQSPYEINPKDKKHMLLVKDNWIESVEYAITHMDEMKKMGKKAHKYVKNEYDIAKNAHKWEKAYKKILK